MNKMMHNVAAMLALCCALVLAAPRMAVAVEHVDPAHTGSLAVRVAYGDQALAGVELSAWRVAGFDAQGQYELDSSFAGAGVDLSALEKASDWDAAAQTLRTWAGERAIVADVSATTSASGEASFAGLVPGLYLICANEVQLDGYVYTPATYLESVPQLVDDEFVYDVTNACKVARTDAPVTPVTPSAPETPETPGAPADGDMGNAGDGGQSWAQRLGLVQTGDNSITLRGVIVLVALGAALVAVGLILWPRRHKDGVDKSADGQ